MKRIKINCVIIKIKIIKRTYLENIYLSNLENFFTFVLEIFTINYISQNSY